MAVVRQVRSKIQITPRVKIEPAKQAESIPEGEKTDNLESSKPKKVCFFCESKKEPIYFDSITLRRFMNDRGKISPRIRTGACSKHQRRLSNEIKRARYLSLLPFTPQI